MQESRSAQDPHPSCPSQQPHFPPSHHPTAPAPAQALCSNPSHPLKPLSSPKELTGSQARCPALPGGSCCCPPCPGTPVDPLGSADLVSPERTNSISQCWGRIGPGSDLCQSKSPERSPTSYKTRGVEDGHFAEPQLLPQEQQLAPGSRSGSMASALVSWQAQGCPWRTQT